MWLTKKLVKFVKLDKEHKDLVHHMKYFHGNISNYVCPYCDKKFQARKLLYNQMQSIHLVKKTNCPERIKDISVNYVSKQGPSRHVKETHERISKPCPLCGEALTISNINKHIISVHKKLTKTCDFYNKKKVHYCTNNGCGKTFMVRNLLTKHMMRTHDSEQSFSCNQCRHRATCTLT